MRVSSLSVFAIVAVLPHYVRSFCVYNDVSDATEVSVDQIENYGGPASGRFQKYDIRPGDYYCCAPDERTCNNAPKAPTNIVKFKFYRNVNDDYTAHWGTITVPADGRLVFRGTAADPHFVVKWGDGNDYPYELEYSTRGQMFVNLHKTRAHRLGKDKSDHHGANKKIKHQKLVDKKQLDRHHEKSQNH